MGVCRFVDRSGQGCRWGANCFFCHICERSSTYNRIQRCLAGRKDKVPGPTDETSQKRRLCRERNEPALGMPASAGQPPLLKMVSVCPELILEGALGKALAPAALSAMTCAHPTTARLMTGESAMLLWRGHLRCVGRGSLVISAKVVDRLTLQQLWRYTTALGRVVFKSIWHIEEHQELEVAVEAAEEAFSRASSGSTLFAFSSTYRSRGGGGRGTQVRGANVSNTLEEVTTDVDPNADHADTDADGRSDGEHDTSVADDLDSGAESEAPNNVRTGRLLRFICPRVHGDAIQMLNGQQFKVAPVIVALDFPAENMRPPAGPQYKLMPMVLDSSIEHADPRPAISFKVEASLWSASSYLQDFKDAELHEQRPVSVSAISVLLGPGIRRLSAAGNPSSDVEGVQHGVGSLRTIAAVRCVQRFWDIPLK